ncbi:MAG: hypothetical protein MZV70_29435 [Desulfobacterales bacterium]|nr:hypothetical protein [Desulfobacterales bacterium]
MGETPRDAGRRRASPAGAEGPELRHDRPGPRRPEPGPEAGPAAGPEGRPGRRPRQDRGAGGRPGHRAGRACPTPADLRDRRHVRPASLPAEGLVLAEIGHEVLVRPERLRLEEEVVEAEGQGRLGGPAGTPPR